LGAVVGDNGVRHPKSVPHSEWVSLVHCVPKKEV
jgi:hypothetical protein